MSYSSNYYELKKKKKEETKEDIAPLYKNKATAFFDRDIAPVVTTKETKKEKEEPTEQELLDKMTPTQRMYHNKVGGFVDTNWGDRVSKVTDLILSGGDTDYKETDKLLGQLKAQQERNNQSTSFSVLAKSKGENSELQRQYNSLIIAKQRDILSKTKLDGTNRTVLEEMQLLAEMKSGKEKDKRKAAVFKKMEELGIKADDYALFSGDKNFTWDSFGGWLKNSAQAGFNSFNKGVASTADLILGKPLQALGWENNPVSLAKEYYDSTYESSKVSQQLYADRLGGGKGLDFAGEAVEGTTGAVPQALMALMSMGTSLSTTSSSLATKAAYETGNVLTKAGLTVEGMMKNPQYWLSFIRTYGSDYEQAKEMGASDEVAVLGATLTSLVNSGIEIGIDGGSGIQGLPDDIADGGSKLLAWAIAGAEEGGEEGLQKFVNEAVTKTMYNHDADILNPKEYGKEMAIGTLSGWGLGAGQIAVASGVNAYNEKQANKLTENEQKVVDKVVEEKVAEAEKGGKVTRSEKAKITKEVIDQLNKGYISTDTIEEVFGDRSSYDSLVQEADEFNALYTMESGKMTRQQQVRLAELEAKNEANPYETAVKAEKDKLSQGVFELVKDSRLAESYNEKTRKGQKFEADLSQYDKKYHATIQKAIDSGILNNSNRTHEFVDIVSKISADKGVPFDFANNEKIKESGFAVEGMTVDGYITADGITINIDSPRAWQSTVGHEVTHILEGTDLYDEVKTTLFDYAKSKGEYQSRYDSIVKRYKEGTDYEAELVADLVGDYLFQDADFVKKLSVEHRNVFQKIYDEVKYLSKVVTAGSKEARDLEKVRKAFEEAYRADTKAQTETKYSISETTDGRLVAVVDSDILSNIDTSTWDNATKKKAKKAASEELKKFADGFTINGIDFIGNKDTRAEYTRADYSEALAHQNPTAYLDKMRASAVIDDVIQVATDWKNDGELKHKREDYVDFVRGKTLIMSGDRTYKAIVLAGITSGGRAIFYDVVSVYPNSFKVKKAESSTTVSASELPNSIKDSTTHNLAHNEANVNAKYSLSDGTKDVAKGQQLWYNNKRGEEYVRTDEFRSLQAESQRMSDEEWNFYLRGGKNEDVRRRVSTVLQRQMDAWRSSGGTHNGRLRLSGKGNQFNMYEGVDPSLFHDIFEVSRKYLQNGELVDLHEIETTEDGIGYNDCYNYLSEDGLSGFSITPDGDLISVFNASDKGGFLRAISDTVKAKAKTLDCYASPNQNLMEMYQKFFGFKTASVMDYNMEFDHDSIAENHNRPKIAFMVNTESNVETRSFTEEQYDEALEYRNSFINRATNNEVVFFMPKNADTDIDARRSISKNGEQSKKHGNFHTPATELKYAPAKETSEPTKATISKPENVAPVAEKSSAVAPTNEVTDLFSDDLAPVYSELDKLELEKQALEDRMNVMGILREEFCGLLTKDIML